VIKRGTATRLDPEYIAMVLSRRMDSEMNVPKKLHHAENSMRTLHVLTSNIPYGEVFTAILIDVSINVPYRVMI